MGHLATLLQQPKDSPFIRGSSASAAEQFQRVGMKILNRYRYCSLSSSRKKLKKMQRIVIKTYFSAPSLGKVRPTIREKKLENLSHGILESRLFDIPLCIIHLSIYIIVNNCIHSI